MDAAGFSEMPAYIYIYKTTQAALYIVTTTRTSTLSRFMEILRLIENHEEG
jgi:hypothetical protein